MVGALKVGGILVEQGGPATLLVGVGLNVTNRPWLVDPGLQGMAGRLADAMSDGHRPPTSAELIDFVLMAIQRAHETFARHRLAGFVPRLNECWGPPRPVVLEPAAGVQETEIRGWFHGIDAAGHVLVRDAAGEITAVPAHHIGRLHEVAGL
jgi:biotin-(acetyl-CoA carboxylase) ligase